MRMRAATAVPLLLTLVLLAVSSACGAKPTPTPSPTPTPRATATLTLPPPTPTPFYTRSPLMTAIAGFTPTPVQCQATPQWGLGDVWNLVRDSVGCPLGPQMPFQGQKCSFQSGLMIWRGDLKVLYVLYYSGEPRLEVYRDTYAAGEATPVPLPTPTPALGLPMSEPTGPFQKLWREVEGVRQRLGWCVSDDPTQACPVRTFEGIAQDCERGTLLWDREAAFALFFADMTWEMY
ncbi:MAG: hypothetical protein H5T65_10180 [Chloroflexi bacterium]|nr:hypothetical protein [Chloroflexota bacterium]